MENIVNKNNNHEPEKEEQQVKVWKCDKCKSTWTKAVPVLAIGPKDDIDGNEIIPKMQAIQLECAGCGKPIMIQGVQKIQQKSNIVTAGAPATGRQRFNFPGAR